MRTLRRLLCSARPECWLRVDQLRETLRILHRRLLCDEAAEVRLAAAAAWRDALRVGAAMPCNRPGGDADEHDESSDEQSQEGQSPRVELAALVQGMERESGAVASGIDRAGEQTALRVCSVFCRGLCCSLLCTLLRDN